jgi:cytochrome c peroxidase
LFLCALVVSAAVFRVVAFTQTPLVTGPVPAGLDLYLPWPDTNPPTTEQVALGRGLFRDRRLSVDESLSCATCHDPERAFSSSRALSIGVFGRVGTRNVPAIINRAYGTSFFWDGRTTSLEEQVLRPIEAHDEMGFTADAAAARVALTREALARALASYVRSILSGNSPFDRFVAGDRQALSPQAQAGLAVFRGRGRCTSCHLGPTFTDELFHNTGVAWLPPRQAFQDDGRYLVTGRDTDRGAFKTPTLREVSNTSPYMHDGSLATLEDVVAFYDEGGRGNPNLDVDVRPLGLTAEEKRVLVAFLGSISGEIRDRPRR